MPRTLHWWIVVCCSGVLLAAMGAAAAPVPSPIGRWLTANGHGVVAITACGDALCGTIAGIDRASGEPMPTDVQGHQQCGLAIISGEKPEPDRKWHGWVTDPRSGTTYHALLWMDARGDLHIRGYVLLPLLGRTQVWHRFTGRIGTDCRFS